MSYSTTDIELIVREVFAQLFAAHESPKSEPKKPEVPRTSLPNKAPGKTPSEVHSESKPNEHPFTLTVAAPVITMNEVAGQLASIRHLVVPRKAIVTPAVRDELLRRGIALEFADSSANRPAVVRLALVISGTDFDPASLVAGLSREGFCVERSTSDCLIAAVDSLANEITKPDTLGVLVTPHAAAGLCLANRLAGIRAITGGEASVVATAAAAVAANLLVVDPKAGSFFQLKQAITEFGRGGVRPCPDVFRTKLA